MHRGELAIARVVVFKRTSFNFIAAAMMTVFFCVSTFGQTMYVITYSDVWGDADYLYACGVTDAYDWGHNGRVSTRITAPNGYYNEVDSGEQSDYARADVSFPIYGTPVTGEYFVQSEHWQWCPTAFQLEYAGSTFDSIPVFGGYSISWHYKGNPTGTPGQCNYHVLVPCSVKCRKPDTWETACGGAWKRSHWDWFGIGSASFCGPTFPNFTVTDHASRFDACGDY